MSGLFACYAANELRTDSPDLPRNPGFSFSKTFCECGCECGVTGLERYQEDLLNSETSSQGRTRRSWLKEFRRSAQRQNNGATASKKVSEKKNTAPWKSGGRRPMSAEARNKLSDVTKQGWAQRRN